jgi:flap endonuclease-1
MVRSIFLHPEVTDDYSIRWNEPDIDAIIRFLCDERDFSRDRVSGAVERAWK